MEAPSAASARIAVEEMASGVIEKVMTFSMTPLAISSTAIRALVAEGSSIRYLAPDPVVEFIRSRHIYSRSTRPEAVEGQTQGR